MEEGEPPGLTELLQGCSWVITVATGQSWSVSACALLNTVELFPSSGEGDVEVKQGGKERRPLPLVAGI